MKTNNESRDNVAAIGIGAMIVFIALILVAAVAAAVIIQTAEKLQQNAQTAGDDTADNMAGKLFIDTAFVDTADAANDYMLFVKLAPGSEITNIDQVTFQMFCENGAVEGDSDGDRLGALVVGEPVGDMVGCVVLGDMVGWVVLGDTVGVKVGDSVGSIVGLDVLGDEVGDVVDGDDVGDKHKSRQ